MNINWVEDSGPLPSRLRAWPSRDTEEPILPVSHSCPEVVLTSQTLMDAATSLKLTPGHSSVATWTPVPPSPKVLSMCRTPSVILSLPRKTHCHPRPCPPWSLNSVSRTWCIYCIIAVSYWRKVFYPVLGVTVLYIHGVLCTLSPLGKYIVYASGSMRCSVF